MIARRAFRCLVVALIMSAGLIGQPVHSPAALQLTWQRHADLPDPIGLKGMYGGASEGQVLLAGGSNFPVPQRSGGSKKFHRAIFVRPIDAEPAADWERAGAELPIGMGEGASVTTSQGVVCIGGHDDTRPLASVFILRWNRTRRQVERAAMPDLPKAVANASAAELGGWLYVAGGDGPSRSLGTFLRLNVARAMADASARWEVLPGWPGRPRYGAMLVAVTTAQGDGLWLGGGIEGPARSQADYLRDALVYDPAARAWRRVARMPRGAVMGAAVKIDASRLLVLGGSDGHDFQRMRELADKYRIPGDVLLYDARADRWLPAGAMPLGLVGAAVVRERDGWLAAGGEYTPGLRTPAVYRLTLGAAGTTGAVRAAGKTK